MRDSNSRGVAPNTLSKSVDLHSAVAATACDLGGKVSANVGEQPRTQANETGTETQNESAAASLRHRTGGFLALRRAVAELAAAQ